MKLEQLIELAKEVEMADPIDWEGLSISESAAYTLIASSILERYENNEIDNTVCLLYTSPSPRDRTRSRMPSSA